jgi:VWFA-related protein
MSPSARTAASLLAIALSAPMGLGVLSAGREQQTPPKQRTGAFRSRITVVPVDVRVFDNDGKPVTDLTQEHFTILEDGVPQSIGFFWAQRLTPESIGPANSAASPPALRTDASGDLKARNRRVFLIQLGRGRMQGPSKELPALLDFLRARLLPQDQVAVLAYNRATDFTTDHSKLASVVERFRDRQEKIEAMLAQHFSGLRAVYGSKAIPAEIQREIDTVFDASPSLRPREIRAGQITDAERIAADTQKTATELQRAELLAERSAEFAGLPDSAATETADRLGVSFEEYVAAQVELMHDLGNLYAGIDYLRYIDGEKHLVFVTPRGVSLPRIENTQSLAFAASDARVAIDIIYTGGTVGAPPPRFSGPGTAQPGRIIMTPLPAPSAVFGQTFDIQALRDVSALTGGQTTAFRPGDYAFDRLDTSTRFQYLLGYAPLNPATDGRTRRIAVRVNRSGVTVVHRQRYYATEQLVPLDRRQFVTYSRITEAGRYTGVIRDIEVTLKPPTLTGEGASRELVMDVTIRSPRLNFAQVAGQRVAKVDFAIYCGDDRERVVGESIELLDLRLGEEGYARFLKEGATYTARVRVNGDPAYVKAIVYNYEADIAGTASRKLR